LADRIRLHLEYVSPAGVSRRYDLPGRSQRVPLDPRWHQAVSTFVSAGFRASFGGDRLVLLVCLIMPFRRFGSLLAVVLATSGLQIASLSAAALGAAPNWRLTEPLFAAAVAAAVLILAIENVGAPGLRRRGPVACVVGGHALADDWQFAGGHALAAAISFDAGVMLGHLAALALAFAALRIAFTNAIDARAVVTVLSAVFGHLGWHWLMDASHRTEHAAVVLTSASLAAVGWWLLLGLFAGGAAWFFPSDFGGAPVPPLLATPDRRS